MDSLDLARRALSEDGVRSGPEWRKIVESLIEQLESANSLISEIAESAELFKVNVELDAKVLRYVRGDNP